METKKTNSDKIQETTEKIGLSGLNILDLMNPKLLQQFKEEKLSVIPFILGLDIDNGNILLITHNEKKEVEDKIIHLECKISTKGISYLKKMSDILKKMV